MTSLTILLPVFNGASTLHSCISDIQNQTYTDWICYIIDDGSTENRNAGATRHEGLEYTIQYVPIEDLTLRLSGTNARHQYQDFIESGNDYTGNEMAAAPSWIVNAELTYRPRFIKGFRIGVEWQHVDDYFMEANTDTYEGFDIYNLRIGYKLSGFGIWLNVMNINNEIYATRASKSQWGVNYTAGSPRTFNLGLSYNFKGKKK